MTVHVQRLKIVTFTIGGNSFDCQLQSWSLDYGVKDGDRLYSFCSAGEGNNVAISETDPEPTLDLKFFSDWRSNGISDYLTANNGLVAAFVLDHHPDVIGEHVQWSGNVVLKIGTIGGDARATEMTEVTLQVVGTPTYTRVG